MLQSILLVFDDSSSGITKDDFLSKLFPNPWDALAIFLAFVVLVLVAFFFAYKPVKQLIQKRKDYVNNQTVEADKKEQEASYNRAKAQEQLNLSRQEGMKIVAKAKEDAETERKLIQEQAKKDADAEVQRSKEEIARQIETSKDEIHQEIVDVALDASSKVLGREVTSEDNERLVNDFVKDLNKKGK